MIISINSDINSELYTDDSTILFSNKGPCGIAGKLGKVLEPFSSRLIDKILSFHFGKAESIWFYYKRKLKNVKQFILYVMDIY